MKQASILSHIAIIGGPTASGKSDYAIELAKRIGGEIINGDSMQVYRHLHILTARPTDLQGIPHHLYGVLEGGQVGSLGWWYGAACQVIQQVQSRGKMPIVVGGTGLYLRALTRGLSPMPDIPESIRQEARQLAQALAEEDFFELVSREDPKIKEVLHPNDTQRLTRALEVVRATQTSIQDCQGQPKKILDLKYQYFVLLPPREVLYQRINDRFIWMVENGALKEVKNLITQNINPDSPILKAVGVPELTAHLQGRCTLEQAIIDGQKSARRYAKRQTTWFTHQAPEAEVINKTGTSYFL